MHPKQKTNTPPVARLIWVVILIALTYCVVQVIIWSFWQTVDFTKGAFGEDDFALIAAFIVQFAPTPLQVIAARMEREDKEAAGIYRLFAVGFTFLDILTNVVTYSNQGTWRKESTALSVIYFVCGNIVSVVAAWAEEVVAQFVALAFEQLNEIRKAAGWDSWGWAEWAKQTAYDAGFGSGNKRRQQNESVVIEGT